MTTMYKALLLLSSDEIA